jgi:hypothetical protein
MGGAISGFTLQDVGNTREINNIEITKWMDGHNNSLSLGIGHDVLESAKEVFLYSELQCFVTASNHIKVIQKVKTIYA